MRPWLMLSLMACNGGLAAHESQLRLERVLPNTGPSDGGVAVRIDGRNFDQFSRVSIGGVEADVQFIDEFQLSVTLPPGPPGDVDVFVRGNAGEATLKGGFRYLEPSEDGQDTGETEGPPPIVGYAEMIRYQVACVSCVDWLNEPFLNQMNAWFHEPQDVNWLGWQPGMDQCKLDVSPTIPVENTLDVGGAVVARTSAVGFNLERSEGLAGPEYIFDDGELDTFVALSDDDWELQTSDWLISGMDGVPNFTDDFAPVGIRRLYPPGTPGVNADEAAFTYPLSRTGFEFTWGLSVPSADVIVETWFFSNYTGEYLGSLTCREADDGSFTIPGPELTHFPHGTLAMFFIARQVTGRLPAPDLGGDIQTQALTGFVGTGVLRDLQ